MFSVVHGTSLLLKAHGGCYHLMPLHYTGIISYSRSLKGKLVLQKQKRSKNEKLPPQRPNGIEVEVVCGIYIRLAMSFHFF